MATSKKRINITLSKEMDEALRTMAKRNNAPQAAEAVRLIKIGLEIDEDAVWDHLAEQRDTPGSKFVSHTKAWS